MTLINIPKNPNQILIFLRRYCIICDNCEVIGEGQNGIENGMCAKMEIFIESITRKYLITLFVILLFSIKLLNRKAFKNTRMRYFWMTVLSCLFLVLTDILETVCSKDPSLRLFRTLFSILCYVLRSTSALGLLLVIMPKNKKRHLLWIPTVINLLVCCTAFFSDIAFGFDKSYAFYRGPLGCIVFIVPLFYLLFIIIIVFTRFSTKKGAEKFIVPLCCIVLPLRCFRGHLRGRRASYGSNNNKQCFLLYDSLFKRQQARSADRPSKQTGVLRRLQILFQRHRCSRIA